MSRKPNLVLINCDDLGYGDLGCYGSTLNKTPFLDNMAAEGIRLTDFYTCSPVCSPSRGGMMTGCYPPRIGFGDFDGRRVLFPGMRKGLNPDEDTLSSILKSNGYATKLVGKWHCGDQLEFMPIAHGFDEYLGFPYSNDMGRQVGLNQVYPPLPLIDGETVIEQQPDQCSITDLYTKTSIEFIKKNVDKPFFLYLAHMHVHRPLYAEKRFVEQSQNGDYGACVAAIDNSTGTILETLKQLGLEENTLVIFTSDNGGLAKDGGSNSPLRGKKSTTWEGGQRVCCLMNWKGTIQKGTTSNAIMSNIDFLPTFLKIADIDHTFKNKIDGVDCSGVLLSKGEVCGRDTFYYYLANNLEAVRVGDWKLHVLTNELYNLRCDIAETENLYNENPTIVKKLTECIDDCRKRLGDSSTDTKGSEVREAGISDNPKPLTVFDENHPYVVAMYDREDFG